MTRRPEKTDAGRRTGNMLGVVIPGVMTPFDKAVVGGISASGDGEWTLMTVGFGADAAVSGDAEGLVRLCLDERVAGVFLRPIPGKDGDRKTAMILAQFRKAKIPVVLFDNAASKMSKRLDCDSVSLIRRCPRWKFSWISRFGGRLYRPEDSRAYDSQRFGLP